MNITFYPDSDDQKLITATEEYKKIWVQDGKRIIVVIEKVSGLKFKESFINAIVYEGISNSHPLALRSSYDVAIKKGTLIHELLHRLLVGNKVHIDSNSSNNVSLEVHKVLDLILYDIWIELFGA